MTEVVVPASHGRAVEVPAGRYIRIVTPQGHQAADFFAFRADDPGEWLSPMHTWVTTRSIRPRKGDVFLSRYRRPMLEFTVDKADGIHDMFLAACDAMRYELLGVKGHRSCAENLGEVMHARGHKLPVTPQPVNFFTNTKIHEDGALRAFANPVKPGAYVELEAKADLICVVSSCPFDLNSPGWAINGDVGPTELVVEVR
ncbi:MAG: urea carboxylase-associated family protein [Rhodospirillaceae bacterium]|nr:urea carboxylase-associated family protein [Rhodospirillaceae bacterium]